MRYLSDFLVIFESVCLYLAIINERYTTNEENVKGWLHGKTSLSNATKVSYDSHILKQSDMNTLIHFLAPTYTERIHKMFSYNQFKSTKDARSPSYEDSADFML